MTDDTPRAACVSGAAAPCAARCGKRCVLRALAFLTGVVMSDLAAEKAFADVHLYGENGLAIDGALQLGSGLFSSPNANFGLGTYSNDGSRRIAGSPTWIEGFANPELKASYYRPEWGQFYGDASAVAAMTLGDGDANLVSATQGNPASVALENALVGWRSGFLFGDLHDDAVDVSLGRQSFAVGDGFLIQDGTADVGRRAAYYLGPRTAFDGIGVLRVNTEPVRGDVFVLRNTVDQKLTRGLDQPQTDFAGANIEWYQTSRAGAGDGRFAYGGRARYVGLTALHVYDADSNGCFSTANCADGPAAVSPNANRDGLNVISLRAGGSPIAALEDLTFFTEYARELNDRSGHKVDANAWYLEPGWTFAKLPWAPRIFYRYSHFSGDGSPGNQTKGSFDPLFTTNGARGLGTWTMGEIAGQYFIFNSNDNVHQVGLTLNPTDVLQLSAFAYRFDYDAPAQFGGTASHAMDELDFVAVWSVTQRLQITGGLGIARPGAGGKQFLESSAAGFAGVQGSPNHDWVLTELYATYKF